MCVCVFLKVLLLLLHVLALAKTYKYLQTHPQQIDMYEKSQNFIFTHASALDLFSVVLFGICPSKSCFLVSFTWCGVQYLLYYTHGVGNDVTRDTKHWNLEVGRQKRHSLKMHHFIHYMKLQTLSHRTLFYLFQPPHSPPPHFQRGYIQKTLEQWGLNKNKFGKIKNDFLKYYFLFIFY